MEKEQIIIDGEKYNKCNGCKLWDGYICIGDRSYEPNAEAHRAICNEHMAKEFWKVYHELFYKTQECEELKKELNGSEKWRINAESLNEKFDIKNTRYRKALEDIKEYTRKQFCDNCEDIGSTEYTCHCEYCEYQEYFEIIEKAKDGNNDNNINLN